MKSQMYILGNKYLNLIRYTAEPLTFMIFHIELKVHPCFSENEEDDMTDRNIQY